VEFVTPDPRYFALHKWWLSQNPQREAVKRPRDYQQAQAVAKLAMDYLGLPFVDAQLLAFPAAIRTQLPKFLNELTQVERVNDSIALMLH
jgi:hypothetical protein